MKLSDSLTFILAFNMIMAHAFEWNIICKILVAANAVVLIISLVKDVISATKK